MSEQLEFRVDPYRGEVMIHLNQPVAWMSLRPEAARVLAKAIMEAVDKIEQEALGPKSGH